MNVTRMLFDQSVYTIVISVTACSLLLVFILFLASESAFYKALGDTNYLGYDKGLFFSRLRASLQSAKTMHVWIDEGYARFSKNNIPFVVPDLILGPSMILPPGDVRNIHTRPEKEIDGIGTMNRKIQMHHTIKDFSLTPASYTVDVLRKKLTKNLGNITSCMADEIDIAFKDYWGESNEWHSVPLFESVLKIASRAAERAFTGKPLCRDEEFLATSRKYYMSLLITGSLLNLIPVAMRSFLAPLIFSGGRWQLASILRTCLPVVSERLKHTQNAKEYPQDHEELPDDILQWLIDESHTSLKRDPLALNPERLARRYILLGFQTVPAMGIVLTNAFFDLYSSSPEERFAEGILEECQSVHAESDFQWTKAGIDKLYRLDSALRESMRFSHFGASQLARTVNAPGGITLNNGQTIKKGTVLTVPLDNIHHDPDFYPDPNRYNAFRFSMPFEVQHQTRSATKASSASPAKDAAAQRKLVTTIDEQFFMWAYGAHACPGRFFAAHMMKLILAHLIMYYEVEPLSEKPKMKKIGGSTLPSTTATVRVRRRKVRT